MTNKKQDLSKTELIEQVVQHECTIQLMQKQIDAHSKLIQALITKKYDLRAELNARGLSVDEDAYKRIIGIIKNFDGITPAEINTLLDKIATQNKKELIHNLPGYLNNAMRKEYAHKLKDTASRGAGALHG